MRMPLTRIEIFDLLHRGYPEIVAGYEHHDRPQILPRSVPPRTWQQLREQYKHELGKDFKRAMYVGFTPLSTFLGESRMTFGTRLRDARLAAGLTQQETALIAGITRHEWSRMECGHSLLESTYKRVRIQAGRRAEKLYRQVEAIAHAVNVTPKHLLGE